MSVSLCVSLSVCVCVRASVRVCVSACICSGRIFVGCGLGDKDIGKDSVEAREWGWAFGLQGYWGWHSQVQVELWM